MKKIIFTTLTVLLLANLIVYAQEIPEGAMMLDENTIIKDESGKVVEMAKWMEYMDSGDWTIDPINDNSGKLLYLQLRKATEEEKKMMAEMPMPGSTSPLIGQKAPEFEITDIDGNIISTENTKGKVVVLNFWFTTCKPCVAEIPELNEVYENYRNNKNVVFVSITFEKEKKVKGFLEKNSLKYPVFADAQKTCRLFNVKGYPTNVIIDKHGNYHEYLSGGSPGIGRHISNSIQNVLDGISPNQ